MDLIKLMIHYLIKYVGMFATLILLLVIIIDFTSNSITVIDNPKYTGGLVAWSYLSIMGYIAGLHIKQNSEY